MHLCVRLVTRAIALGVILIGQIYNNLQSKTKPPRPQPHLPFAIGVDRPLWSAVEDVAGTDVASGLVVLGGVRVTTAIGGIYNNVT